MTINRQHGAGSGDTAAPMIHRSLIASAKFGGRGEGSMITRAGICLVIVSMAVPAAATTFGCSSFQTFGRGLERPTQPTCVNELLRPFGDEFLSNFRWQLERCRSEIEIFESRLNDYLFCLKSEGDDALSDYNELVRGFNCKARGSC
jgi:hypothetical protein